jgi:hypothetical protein
MVTFDTKPESIRKQKECACCKKLFNSLEKMFHGHSNFKPTNKDCSSYICETCAGNMQGYIIECFCTENL